MYFCMSTHVYKQVRKCTELFNRATCREEGKGSLFMCIQSDLSCQCSLYRTLIYKELEHLPILVSKEAPGTSPQRYRGMAFYHERDVMFIMRVYNDEYLNLCVCVYIFAHALSCLTLCYPMDSSPLGSSVQGIFKVRILEWVAISYSRGSSRLRDQTHVSYISCVVSCH